MSFMRTKTLSAFILSAFVLAVPALADGSLKLTAPAEGAVVPLLSDNHKAYLDLPRAERVKKFADPAFRREMRSYGYHPEKVRLAWDWAAPEGEHPRYTVVVERLPDHLPVARIDTDKTSAMVENLEIARDYEWKVYAIAMDKIAETATGTFRTEDHAPRLIHVHGVPNVRDLGGWVGLDGRRVRQGLVIRTAGLNENASPVYFTREELLEKDPSLAEKEAETRSEIEEYKGYLGNPKTFRPMLDVGLTGNWTLFLPDTEKFEAEGETALAALDKIPETFLGAAAAAAAMDSASDRFDVPGFKERKGPAVFMQVVNAAEDGWFSISCGADWWWDLRANGKVVFDCRRTSGNDKSVSVDNHPVPVPVKKGANLLVAVVYSGSAGWAWCAKAAPAVPLADLLESKIGNLSLRTNDLYRVRKGTEPGACRLDDASRDYMLGYLGMKSDIDLRSDGECYGMEGSPMGPTVTWFHYSSFAYGGMQSDGGRRAFTKVFKVFLDRANYPIDFHCIAGQDRTGAVAFIVNGLLGVQEDDLYRDWEATGFWNRDPNFSHRDRFNYLVEGFQKWPGETINEKIEAYVLSLGFTKDDIATLRDIMLEEK